MRAVVPGTTDSSCRFLRGEQRKPSIVRSLIEEGCEHVGEESLGGYPWVERPASSQGSRISIRVIVGVPTVILPVFSNTAVRDRADVSRTSPSFTMILRWTARLIPPRKATGVASTSR